MQKQEKSRQNQAIPAGFWSCYPDLNWGPHPYQLIAAPGSTAFRCFRGILLQRVVVFDTFPSIDSVRSFRRVGHGVGQEHRPKIGTQYTGRSKTVQNTCPIAQKRRAKIMKSAESNLAPQSSLDFFSGQRYHINNFMLECYRFAGLDQLCLIVFVRILRRCPDGAGLFF